MQPDLNENKYILKLKAVFNQYATISDENWELFVPHIRLKTVTKGAVILNAGQTAKNIYFICKGSTRTFFVNADGHVYNKNIFLENSFPASTVSLIQGTPSYLSIEALEDSILIQFNFKTFKKLIAEIDEFKNFYIAYIEQNWIVKHEQKDIEKVMEHGTERYLKLLEKHPDIEKRIALHHIASHLGITPTQFSRIRKELKK